jgi:hypothetical protein
MALDVKVRASVRANLTGTNDFGGPIYTPELLAAIDLASGTGANQSDLIFADERTVASASNDDLDLAGVLLPAFGSTLAFVNITAIMVVNRPRTGAANTTNLTIGGGTNAFVGFLGGTTPTIGPIRPGGVVLLSCGAATGIGAVVAGTGDILRIANSAGAAATYQIMIVGRSA